MARPDTEVLAHLEWLGFVQPTGLVISAPALVRAGAILERGDTEGQRLLRNCVEERELAPGGDPESVIPDFTAFAGQVLEWSFSPKGYAGTDKAPIPPELEVTLPEYGETLRPDFAVREREPADGASQWQLLVRVLDIGESFETETRTRGQLEASAHGRMERLLRETGVPAGLLFNGRALRLLSAPRGESSGWLEFQVSDMIQTTGRPISTALRLLLRESRLLTLPPHQRLLALLEASRKFQNEVSEKLSEQVLHALYELLRGFQAAHDATAGTLLSEPLAERSDDVYRALLTVILRLVFLLYAEEREMLPASDTYLRFYSLVGLYERLRADDARYPDTMNQRYGAWAQMLALFRMIHDGAEVGDVTMPPRHSALFDPDRFSFLEGRTGSEAWQIHERIEPPLVPDGTIYRALEKLLVLDGERISYRALDVEQIGSVYETMMGFRLELATGRSLAVKAPSRYGAPTTVDLEALLRLEPGKRGKWLKDQADRKLTPKVEAAVKGAGTLEDIHAALMPVVDLAATPDVVPAGSMVLQPSKERRNSGSHYTPRALTEPIVRTTLEPIFQGLRLSTGETLEPEQILDVKICDPAMGSGAFLVEACRQLGDALVEAWNAHGRRPEIPLDEDELTLARRMVAQRCLYGVDRNAVAVDLAKMSLWLVTLAREHPFTFVDHALRHGDSLVGLTREQIESFHWKSAAAGIETIRIGDHLAKVTDLRRGIREAGEDVSDWALGDMWDEAQAELSEVRLIGDLVVAAFFTQGKAARREERRLEFAQAVAEGQAERYRWLTEEMRHMDIPVVPFHWQVEFPEVFERELSGFDAIVGNPPFAGKNTMAEANPEHYADWLKQIHEQSHGNADLVAHFFRRGFELLRRDGAFGLIATNTIGQGDTRSTGLRWICTHGGEIYLARRRVKWPGRAAVVVSVVHVLKGTYKGRRRLDEHSVDTITAYLLHRGGHEDPARLAANAGKSFQGSIILGMGFTFDDKDRKGIASSLAEMQSLIEEEPRNAEVIFPYIGGEEVNTSPVHAYHRYAIDFFDREESECRRNWPKLMAIIEERVLPERERQKRKALRERWWQYAEKRPGLRAATADLECMLVTNCGAAPHFGLAFQPANRIFAHTLIVFPLRGYASFCGMQARPHELWARCFGSSMKDDLRYTSSDCFETFPFPEGWEHDCNLESAGEAYYEFRAALMKTNDEGLTKIYNRFHDPYEHDSEIIRLRTLHTDMDRAVLQAYGWDDIPTHCEFVLDYEVDEGEGKSKKKKPYSYRWPDDVRDEVLVRLVELNAERAGAERLAGVSAGIRPRKASARSAAVAKQPEGLF